MMRYLWFYLLLVCFPLVSNATHIVGGEITYRYIGGSDYELTVILYRDCEHGMANFDNWMYLFVHDAINDTFVQMDTLFRPDSTPQLPPGPWPPCTGEPYTLCTEEGIYMDTISLPFNENGYNIGWARCCRNEIIDNLVDPLTLSITFTAHVPGSTTVALPNSMAMFNNSPPAFLCANVIQYFDYSATDMDGDSLVYILSDPLNGVDTLGNGVSQSIPWVYSANPLGPPPYQNVPFEVGFDSTDPFGNGIIHIDSSTGYLSLNPGDTGVYVFAVSVLEFRDGILISENKRDYQYHVIQCMTDSTSPVITPDLSLLPNSNDTIFAFANTPFCFDFTVTDLPNVFNLNVEGISPAFGGNGGFPAPFANISVSGTNPLIGSFCWNPSCDLSGQTIPLIFTAWDSAGCIYTSTSHDTVWVNITAQTGLAPTTNSDFMNFLEDGPAASIDVLLNDFDLDSPIDSLDFSVIQNPANFSVLSFPQNGVVTYAPATNFVGEDTLVYQLCDNFHICTTFCKVDTLFLRSVGTPDPPVAEPDLVGFPEDSENNLILVLQNDTDPENNIAPGSVSIVTQPLSGGSASSDVFGNVYYTPPPNFIGIDTFTYLVCDSTGLCDSDTVFVIVSQINEDPPIAVVDSYFVAEDTIDFPVYPPTGDSDPDGNLNPVSVSVLSPPEFGTTSIGIGGEVLYSPQPNYFGWDSFNYSICDFTGLCDSSTVYLFIDNDFTDPPIANPDTDTITNNGQSSTVMVVSNDTDADNNLSPSSVNVLSQSGNGSVGTNGLGEIIFLPDPGFSGLEVIQYEVCDFTGLCDTTLVEIYVFIDSLPPVAVVDYYILPEDTQNAVLVSSSNDYDLNGDILPFSVTVIVPPTSGGTAVPNEIDGMIYTPAQDFWGQDTIVYFICDLTNLCDTDTVFVNILPVLEPPKTQSDIYCIDEDSLGTGIPVLTNDYDPDGNLNPSSLTILEHPFSGADATLNLDNTINYIPIPNYSLQDTIVYLICDSTGFCSQDSLFICINEVPDPPVAVIDFVIGEQGGVNFVSPLLNDYDIDGDLDTLSLNIIENPVSGASVVILPGGIFQLNYTGIPAFFGFDTLLYQICDSLNLCDIDTVIIELPNGNPPVAYPDYLVMVEGDSLAIICPAENDTDPNLDLDTSSIGLVTGLGYGGTILPDGNNCFSYTPPFNYFGNDTVVYIICDQTGLCDFDTIFITILPLEDPPFAVPDYDTLSENSMPVSIDLGSNDFDPDFDLNLGSIAILTPPVSGGEVSLNGVNGVIYEPPVDFFGNDTMTYQICDSTGNCDFDTLFIFVVSVLDPPSANPDIEFMVENSPPVSIFLLGNDSDPDNDIDTLSLLVISGSQIGASWAIDTHGNMIYQPPQDYIGTDLLIYQICDFSDPPQCDIDTVYIYVLGVNQPPVAVNDTFVILEDQEITAPIILNDSDAEGPIIDIESLMILPENGSLVLNDDFTFTYVPNPNFEGVDSFFYQICDEGEPVLCDSAWVIITVFDQPDPPTAFPDSFSTWENTGPFTFVITENDTSFFGDSIEVLSYTDPQFGTLIQQPDGSFSYEPDQDYFGWDEFTYIVCDTVGQPFCDTSYVVIWVQPVNQFPVAQNDYDTIFSGDLSLVPPLENDFDPENDPLSFSIYLTGALHGEWYYSGDELVYIADADFIGNDTLYYVMCDTGFFAGCDSALIVITVLGNNIPPTPYPDSVSTSQNEAVFIPLILNDRDEDLDSIYFSQILEDPANGILSIDSSGSAIYLPNEGFVGLDSFSYQICDDGSPVLCADTTVFIWVEPEGTIEITTGISPNGDGQNEFFIVGGLEGQLAPRLFIYNRWGNLVYSNLNYSNNWSGTSNLGKPLPDGTYFYLLYRDGKELPWSGYVILFR